MGKHIHNLFLPSRLKNQWTDSSTICQKGTGRGGITKRKPSLPIIPFRFRPSQSQYTAGRGRQQCSSEQAKHANKNKNPSLKADSQSRTQVKQGPRHRPAQETHHSTASGDWTKLASGPPMPPLLNHLHEVCRGTCRCL